MNLNEDFDTVGKDGIENKRAFDKLPVALRYFIHSTQSMIVDKVVRRVTEKYGEDGVKSLRKTSGFRAFSVNNRVGGVVDSLHLFGCAVDFAKDGIFKNKPIPVCCNLECIDSGVCWHIQLKRGN